MLDYNYFNVYYKMIVIDSNKQQALDADPKVMQQINFTGNIKNNATIFLFIAEVKEMIFDFSQETVKVLQFYFALI